MVEVMEQSIGTETFETDSFVIMTETTEFGGKEEESTEVIGIDDECNGEQDDDADYDPLGVTDGPEEVATETVSDHRGSNDDGRDSESDDSIIELDMEQCSMCSDNFETKQELAAHLAKRHFEAGLLADLRKHNWEDGSLMCPRCREVTDDVLLHWARDHNKVDEMVNRCLNGGEIRLIEEKQYCHKFIEKWFKVDITMANDVDTDNEIKKQLAGPEESAKEKEQDDEIIVLDDSSDESDIEILETVESSINDQKQEVKIKIKAESPILEIVNHLKSFESHPVNDSKEPPVRKSGDVNAVPIEDEIAVLNEETSGKDIGEETNQKIPEDNTSVPKASVTNVVIRADVNTGDIIDDINQMNNERGVVCPATEPQSLKLDSCVKKDLLAVFGAPLIASHGVEENGEREAVNGIGNTSEETNSNIVMADNNDNNDVIMLDVDEGCESLQPEITQCLECFVDLRSVSRLTSHMLQSEHINISWAANTNNNLVNGSQRWYHKAEKYTCVECFKETNASLCFTSIKAVMIHIIFNHNSYFEMEYINVLTPRNYIICKICKSFLYFNMSLSDKSRKKKEFGHYLNNHGQVFLFSLGILNIDIFNQISCQLCRACKTSDFRVLSDHLQLEHNAEIIKRFRSFPMALLSSAKRPQCCCICQADGSSPEHLASHDLNTLVDIGLVETNERKVMCKCCHSVSVHIARIVSHFADQHSQLFNFLTSQYLKLQHRHSSSVTAQPNPQNLNHTAAPQYYQPVSTILQPSSTSQQPVVIQPLSNQQEVNCHMEVPQEIPKAEQVAPKKAPGSGGFESAFLSFVGSAPVPKSQSVESEPLTPLGFELKEIPSTSVQEPSEPNVPSIENGSNVVINKIKRSHSQQRNVHLDEICKICQKSFDRINSKGETKSNGKLKVEINSHYLSHFRDRLVSKYPSSFSGTPPLKCEKCGFVSKSDNLASLKQLMLTHIASCQGELEELINNCSKKTSLSPQSTKQSPPSVLQNKSKVSQNKQETSVGWKTSSCCLVCNANVNDNIKGYHYVNHFKDKMQELFLDNQEHSSVIKCPYCYFFVSKDSNVYANIQFFIHVGSAHDQFSTLIAQHRRNSPVKPRNLMTNLNGCENKENNLEKSPSKSSESKFLKTYHTFVKEQETNPRCLKCNQEAENLMLLMRHLMRKHYLDDVCRDLQTFFPDFYKQEVIQAEVRCNICAMKLPAVRSTVTEHVGVAHKEVLKYYYTDMKFHIMKKHDVGEAAEELENESVLTSLYDDLDSMEQDTVEQREKELVAKIQEFLAKAKESGKVFVQNAPCYLVDKSIPQCHECRKIVIHREIISSGSCCCFEGFRKLRFNGSKVVVYGYLDPMFDPKPADIELWSVEKTAVSEDMSDKVALFILSKVGGLLCDMVSEERVFCINHLKTGGKTQVVWRRQHPGVREMCDVCSTTIFNFHLTCGKCGIMVCCDCFTARTAGTRYNTLASHRPYRTRHKLARAHTDLDTKLWPLCTEKTTHKLDELILTQMSPHNVQDSVVKEFHKVMRGHNMKTGCKCDLNCPEAAKRKLRPCGSEEEEVKKLKSSSEDSILAIHNNYILESPGDNYNPLVDLIENICDTDDGEEEDDDEDCAVNERSMGKMIEDWCEQEDLQPGVCQDFPSQRGEDVGLESLSPRHIMTLQESSLLSKDTKHSWLCDGSLLQLEDAVSPQNQILFQYQWARGQPVLICNSNQYMNKNLWHPKAFSKDFGHLTVDLVNTKTGKTVPNQPMKWFWDGFEKAGERMIDSQGSPMLLKLKDWPSNDDIASFIPKRFHDLVHDFPIQAYTLREGSLNIASYIPDYFLKPELGPKMYIAYGNALYSNKASTNLHLDMSDAVNLLVYVGIPKDTNPQENIKLVLQQIDEAGCDISMKKRVRDEGKLPGALWHIYHPGDTCKIRDFLTKIAIENHRRLDPHDDPIHDQSTYLTAELRARLYREYGVSGYAIIQCAGDTVFIPAGACHQVRNLHNCIKIAEDFVSPELSKNCLHLTQEFRNLTEHHTNHEDKLQIKNIIYHSTKNAIAKLNSK